MREYRTPGSLAGLAGDCQSYATGNMGLEVWPMAKDLSYFLGATNSF